MERVNYVVIGIGINIKTIDFPDEIKEKATSLYKEGYKLSRVDIVRQFCIEFEKLYKGYILDGNKQDTLELCTIISFGHLIDASTPKLDSALTTLAPATKVRKGAL